MIRKMTGMLAAALLTFGAAGASAQTVGIATTAGGLNAALGASIAGVVSSKSGLQMRPQKMGGTQQYIPLIDAGKAEFALANVMQYYMAVSGTGLSEGKSYKNLRLAATLMPFYNGMFVRVGGGIDKPADLKGKRVPSGYKSAPLFESFMTEFLRNGGLTWNDVIKVPVVSLPQSWNLFKAGKIDVAIAAAGAGALKDIKASAGDIKFVPLNDTKEIVANLPRTRMEVVKPNAKSVALKEPTMMNVYDYVLFVSAKASDDVVYKIVKSLHENAGDLRKSSAAWNDWDPATIGRDQKLDYHPGALRYFREKGLVK